MEQSISMVRGDTLSFGIQMTGLNQDVDSIYFSCKENYDDADYIFQKSLGDGITKAETGTYTVRVAPVDTQNISAGEYYYDLQVGVNGDVFTLLKGILHVEWDVTREA